MNEATCDVLVVGDGPAGCMAGLTLARAGLRCTMLAPPAPANHRGAIDSVPPLVPVLLEAAGLAAHRFADAIVGRFSGIVSDGVARRFYGETGLSTEQGWHVERGLFDRVLLNHALEQGLTLRRDRVTDAACTTKEVVLQTAKVRHRARWLVDASGRSGLLQRLLGLATVTHGARMVAWRGVTRMQRVADPDAQQKTALAMPTFHTSSTGWLWQASLDDGALAWTWAGDASDAGDANAPPPAMYPFTTGADDAVTARGFDVSWRLVRPAGGAAYRIVGDAAAMLDPRSGQGVLFALSSALAAVRSIVAVEQAPHLRALEAAGYDAFVAQEFRRKSDELTRRMPAPAKEADVTG
ncbi:NAD(P)/FAD-dependent oxidoreductase [Paraburkholderia rhizosphaerae]|nr:FAD-dependent monooxygenase [Paraburkholderia rhizosphaerae]